MSLRVLDLFSGIGGFSLGLERAGMQTVAFCEIEDYPRKVLAKHWPSVPIYDDVRTLNATRLAADGIGRIDLICGGFPCQPFSHAGRRMGAEDDRHLWPEYFRLIKELRPTWIIGENVIGLVSMGLDAVLDDLESIGYACRTFDIPACGVGASHERRRIWILAYSDLYGGQHESGKQCAGTEQHEPCQCSSLFPNSNYAGLEGAYDNAESSRRIQFDITQLCEDVPDSTSVRQSGPGKPFQWGDSTTDTERQTNQPFAIGIQGEWATEPNVGRVANGIPARMDRLKGLGNAVVPQIPEIIGRAILASIR
jgi:DNA (cytosine-5)-methyltransferase 1